MLNLRYALTNFLILLMSLCFFKITAAPLSNTNLDAELMAEKFEGDMLLTKEQVHSVATNTQGRNGLVALTRRWPNNMVFYKIVGNFDVVHHEAILEAINIIEANTCVRFREANASQAYYIEITSNPGGCYTAVGYLAKVQQMNLENFPLNEGCFRTGTMLHELMHSLGFYHQQSDAQRDHFVEILYENIIPGKEFNFEKYNSLYVTDFDVGYDYESCLHYGPTAFSVNGKDTLRPLDENAKIGQREMLSEKDIAKINLMYKCPIFI